MKNRILKLMVVSMALLFSAGMLMIPARKVKADAVPIVPGKTVKADLSSGSACWFEFSLTEKSFVAVDTTGSIAINLRLCKSMDKSDTIRWDNSTNLNNNKYLTHIVDPGTYYILVELSYSSADVSSNDTKVSLNAYAVDTQKVVDVDEANFPDEVFRGRVHNDIDRNRDNILTVNEIKAAIGLSEYYGGELIKSLKGIEYLTSLKYLEIDESDITDIDLSRNTALLSLRMDKSKVSKLDLSNNTKLISLKCSDCELSSLNISKCKDLEVLEATHTNLTSCDLTDLNKLKKVNLQDTKIESIDLALPNLEEFCCGNYNDNNSVLKFLDLSRCRSLKRLLCMGCPDLEKMYLPKTKEELIPAGYQGPNPYAGNDADEIVLTKSDWELTGVTWTGNDSSGYTAAAAEYKCTKSGSTDYTSKVPMTLTVKEIKGSCEQNGKTVYTASLTADKARDGKALSQTKEIVTEGHKWSDWKVKTKSSTGVPGVEVRTCSACKKQEKRNTGSVSVICGKNITLSETMNWLSSNVTWKSSDTKIATVDSKGKITSKMAGKVTITATAAGKSVKCTVTVLYKDVISSSDFWYEPTNYLTAKGVVKGYANQTEFRPANNCTRAQMVTFLYRLQGEPKTKSNKCKFDDVKSTDYFFKPVIWAEEQGITTGVSENLFDPQRVCTRAQTVTFLWRMAGKPEPGKNAKNFSDVEKTDYFYKATLWASGKKILAGYDDGTFRPQGKCLRRQMVTFLYKYDKYVNGKG